MQVNIGRWNEHIKEGTLHSRKIADENIKEIREKKKSGNVSKSSMQHADRVQSNVNYLLHLQLLNKLETALLKSANMRP